MNQQALKHTIEIILTVTLLLAVGTGLMRGCSSMLADEDNTLQKVWNYYDAPNGSSITVELGSGEAIIGYGGPTFAYKHPDFYSPAQLSKHRHIKGFYSERPEDSICVDGQTCICHCGSLNVTKLTADQASSYFGEDVEQSIPDGRLVCEEASCRSHPKPIKQKHNAQAVFGEKYTGYGEQYYEESFAIINDIDLTKPTVTVNEKPYTFAGYAQEFETKQQKVTFNTEDNDARRICMREQC